MHAPSVQPAFTKVLRTHRAYVQVFTEDKAQARGEFWTALGADSTGEPAYEIGLRNRASEQNKRIRFLWLRNKGHKVRDLVCLRTATDPTP